MPHAIGHVVTVVAGWGDDMAGSIESMAGRVEKGGKITIHAGEE